jgi:hypothetical protein
MHWDARIANYVRVTKFPRSLFVAEDGRVVGTWIMGNDYRVKSSYYGGYPAGYLRRIRASPGRRWKPRRPRGRSLSDREFGPGSPRQNAVPVRLNL